MAKILIIDDEAPIRASLREILEYEGYQVQEAENGVEGVRLAESFRTMPFFAISKCLKWTGWRCWMHFLKSRLKRVWL